MTDLSSQAVEPRISLTGNIVVTSVLFSLAIITYAIRSYIRFFVQKQFLAEDGIILFAVLCLVTTTGVFYASMQHVYDSIAVILHSEFDLLLKVMNAIPKVSREQNTAATLVWLVIVPVKLAFLFFFKRLIDRVQGLKVWWWFTTILTILSGLVCVAVSWLTCPYFTTSEVLTCSGPSADHRVIRDTAITTAMDITTDLLVVSIPITLLWKVQLNTRQKLPLGVSLCLSFVMILVAITRMSGIRLPSGPVDIVWAAFWQQQECSIAVIMISVSAFRSFFVASPSQTPPIRHPDELRSWRARLLRKHNSSNLDDTDSTTAFPQIPSATLTGMRTLIQGAHVSTMWAMEDDIESLPSRPQRPWKPLIDAPGIEHV